MNQLLFKKADRLEKADQDKDIFSRYYVIKKPDGKLVRVDVQKARAAMRHAMTLRAKQRHLHPYDQF
jgi:hypothetical protein